MKAKREKAAQSGAKDTSSSNTDDGNEDATYSNANDGNNGANKNNASLTHQEQPQMIATIQMVGNIGMILMEMLTDLDSHADQCILGNKTLVVDDYKKPVKIIGYDPKGPVSRELCMITGALGYDCPNTGETFILIVNQAIQNPKLANNLSSPIQMWLNNVEVSDKPKFLTDQPTEHDHVICVVNHETNKELVIPLMIRGVTSTFPTRKPTG
jgi:hypothetical protein